MITENSFQRNLSLLHNLDPEIVRVKIKLQKTEDKLFEHLVYRKIQGKLLFYVPSSMESNAIRASHEQVGHQGINKYLNRVYWFPRMQHKVQQHVENYLKCITYCTIAKRRQFTLSG